MVFLQGKAVTPAGILPVQIPVPPRPGGTAQPQLHHGAHPAAVASCFPQLPMAEARAAVEAPSAVVCLEPGAHQVTLMANAEFSVPRTRLVSAVSDCFGKCSVAGRWQIWASVLLSLVREHCLCSSSPFGLRCAKYTQVLHIS